MSKYRPSRYIMHSDYATVKTYETLSASVVIPNIVNVPIDSDIIYTATIFLPTAKGIGWRSLVLSNKYSYGVSTPNLLIPCKITEDGYTYDGYAYASVVRISATVIQLQVVFSSSEHFAVDYTDMAQTLTLKIQAYLSPFDV